MLANFADSERANGEFDAAAADFNRAVEILDQLVSTQVIRSDYPLYGYVLNSLTGILDQRKQYGKSEEILTRAKDIDEKTLGESHPTFATVLDNLGALYLNTNRPSLAKPLFERALTIQENALGLCHPERATVLNNLSKYYFQMGNINTAEALLQQARCIYENIQGAQSELGITYNNLGQLYSTVGKMDLAEKYLKKAIEQLKPRKSQRPLDYTVSLTNLGDLYRKRGRFKEAEPLLRESVDIRDRIPGLAPEGMIEVLAPYGGLYFVQNDFGHALPLWERALRIAEQPQAPGILLAQSLNNLGELYRRMGNFAAAEPLLKKAYEMWPSLGLEESDRMLLTCDHYAALLEQKGMTAQATEIKEREAHIKEQLSKRMKVAEQVISYPTCQVACSIPQ